MEFVRNPQSSNMMNVLYLWFLGIGNGLDQAIITFINNLLLGSWFGKAQAEPI